VDYAVSVTLKIIAVRMRRFRMAPSTRVRHRIGSEHRAIG